MIHLGLIGRQFQLGEDGAQKKPGTEFAADQIGVLALPAQPGFLCQRFFHYRGGVHEDFDLGAVFFKNIAGHSLELFLDQIVIVIALGIGGNRAAFLTRKQRQRVVRRAVIQAQHNGAFRLRP